MLNKEIIKYVFDDIDTNDVKLLNKLMDLDFDINFLISNYDSKKKLERFERLLNIFGKLKDGTDGTHNLKYIYNKLKDVNSKNIEEDPKKFKEDIEEITNKIFNDDEDYYQRGNEKNEMLEILKQNIKNNIHLIKKQPKQPKQPKHYFSNKIYNKNVISKLKDEEIDTVIEFLNKKMDTNITNTSKYYKDYKDYIDNTEFISKSVNKKFMKEELEYKITNKENRYIKIPKILYKILNIEDDTFSKKEIESIKNFIQRGIINKREDIIKALKKFDKLSLNKYNLSAFLDKKDLESIKTNDFLIKDLKKDTRFH